MNIETIVERPISEEDNPVIPQAIAFFHTMLDTIANATQLAKDVKSLSEQVAKLRAEVEEVHTRNMQLTEQINAVRTERDNFASEVASLRHELTQAKQEAEYHKNRAENLDMAYANFREQHERDMQGWQSTHSALNQTYGEVSTERDALRKELAKTQDSFRQLEERVRSLTGFLSNVTGPDQRAEPVTEEQVTDPQPQGEEWRKAMGY